LEVGTQERDALACYSTERNNNDLLGGNTKHVRGFETGLRKFLLLALLFAFPFAAWGQGATGDGIHKIHVNDAPERPVGMDALAHPEYLPFLYPAGTQTFQSSSYDLTGKNDDGNFHKAFTRYIDSSGEYVIFDAYGPGCLYRQQFNVWIMMDQKTGKFLPGAGSSRIRFYFDDEKTPRIDLTIDEFFSGHHPPFDAPFSFAGDIKDYATEEGKWMSSIGIETGTPLFAVQYYPLPFARRLKVAFVPSSAFKQHMDQDNSSWYQFTYLLYPPGTKVASWTVDPPSSRQVREQWSHIGADPKPTTGNRYTHVSITIPAGKTGTLFDVQGQGAIASIKMHVSPYSSSTFYGLRLHMTWDRANFGNAAPNFELPIGAFFGGGPDDFELSSQIPFKKLANLFYGFNEATETFYSYWPMPFWSSATIEIVNPTTVPVTITADIGVTPKESFAYPQNESGYFHAKETRYRDSGEGLYARAFHEFGAGQIVGTNFYSKDYSEEGDEFTFINGSRTPQIHGDGTEDDHNQGFGGTTYQKPLFGALVDGYRGSYRLLLADPYVFDKEARITFETSNEGFDVGTKTNRTIAQTDVVAYYYLAPNSGVLSQTDTLDVGIPSSELAHNYHIEGQTWAGSLRSAYDGYGKNPEADTFVEEGRAFHGRSAFTVRINPQNDGVLLRRLLSRSGNGVQTAAVYVDGVKVERLWHVVFPSSAPEDQTWVDSDFVIPASLTHGKSKLRIEIRYVGSSKDEINEFHYWVFSYMARRP
jgi:hypothetical protein